MIVKVTRVLTTIITPVHGIRGMVVMADGAMVGEEAGVMEEIIISIRRRIGMGIGLMPGLMPGLKTEMVGIIGMAEMVEIIGIFVIPGIIRITGITGKTGITGILVILGMAETPGLNVLIVGIEVILAIIETTGKTEIIEIMVQVGGTEGAIGKKVVEEEVTEAENQIQEEIGGLEVVRGAEEVNKVTAINQEVEVNKAARINNRLVLYT